MKYPPTMMRMKVIQPEKRAVNLWLPLFIIVPIVGIIALAAFLVLLPLLLIGALVFWRLGLWRKLLLFWPVTLGVYTALRGLEIDVEQTDSRVLFWFK